MAHVTIIGAGIVGACSACFLQKAGHEVTLIDRVEPGEGCSFGNAGVISTPGSSVQPPSPSLLRDIPKMLFDREATLALRWRYLLRFSPWLVTMMRGCTTADQKRTAEAMASLLSGTTAAYDAIVRNTAADAFMRRNGSLGIYRTQEQFEDDRWRRDWNAELGATQDELTTDELRQLEPSLSEEVKRAVYFPLAYSTTNPAMLTRAIAEEVEAEGGKVILADVTDLVVENGCPAEVKTDQGSFPVDRLVVAAGAFSHRVARMMGIKVLLETERGYHIEAAGVETRLSRPAIHYELACGINPMNTGLRFAGTVEFAGVDAEPDENRAWSIWRRSKGLIKESADTGDENVTTWMGRRPTMPDFRPVIGPAPGLDNCWFAFGHQHLGLTLGARTGEIVGEIVSGRDPGIDLEPFRADRF
ncbi:MAG: FAD-binding oxidoreductase [Rhodospirillaceae bacterium]|nr:FAD-binding oxidoreductase [Rhodospirillaceae bacterium]